MASCREEKEEDIRKLRRQLREKEREAENTNAVLLATEETIDALESQVKDKETLNKKLTTELKDKDKLLRVSGSHARVYRNPWLPPTKRSTLRC